MLKNSNKERFCITADFIQMVLATVESYKDEMCNCRPVGTDFKSFCICEVKESARTACTSNIQK